MLAPHGRHKPENIERRTSNCHLELRIWLNPFETIYVPAPYFARWRDERNEKAGDPRLAGMFLGEEPVERIPRGETWRPAGRKPDRFLSSRNCFAGHLRGRHKTSQCTGGPFARMLRISNRGGLE